MIKCSLREQGAKQKKSKNYLNKENIKLEIRGRLCGGCGGCWAWGYSDDGRDHSVEPSDKSGE